jgi:hypothetical protein
VDHVGRREMLCGASYRFGVAGQTNAVSGRLQELRVWLYPVTDEADAA